MSTTNGITTLNTAFGTPVEIDDILLRIAAIDAEVEHYEALKKHRVSAIDQEIDRLTAQKDNFRDSIRRFMSNNGDTSLNYPGVAKIVRSAGSRKWIVNDEEELLNYLSTNTNISPQTRDAVIAVKKTIVKKELNKVLDDLAKHNALTTDSVVAESSPEQIRITFDKGDALIASVKTARGSIDSDPIPALPAAPAAAPQPVKSSKQSFDDLDI